MDENGVSGPRTHMDGTGEMFTHGIEDDDAAAHFLRQRVAERPAQTIFMLYAIIFDMPVFGMCQCEEENVLRRRVVANISISISGRRCSLSILTGDIDTFFVVVRMKFFRSIQFRMLQIVSVQGQVGQASIRGWTTSI